MEPYNSVEEMFLDMEYKVENLKKALVILLEALDWDDIQEIGGEPLQDAVNNANAVLEEIDTESDE